MSINFKDSSVTNVSISELKGNQGLSSILNNIKGIDPSSQLTGIELRMLGPVIKDNRTPKVWPFPGFAKLYCLTVVVSDVNNQLVGTIDLKGFPRIDDHETLPINKTLYYWQQKNETNKSPTQIHIHCSVIKSKESLRDWGKILAGLKDNKDYKSITDQLKSLAANATPAGVVIEVISSLASIVGDLLGNVEDKPLGTDIRSFTSLYGDFDTIGINPIKTETRNVDFNFELIIRDSNRERQVLNALKSSSEEYKDINVDHILETMEPDQLLNVLMI